MGVMIVIFNILYSYSSDSVFQAFVLLQLGKFGEYC